MALPALTLLDNFNRAAEKPLSNGGKWALLGTAKATGEVAGEGWNATTIFANGQDSAYWTPQEFTNPAIAATFTKDANNTTRWFKLHACLANPTSTEASSYILKLEETTVATKLYTWTLERQMPASLTVLTTVLNVTMTVGDLVALQVTGGKLYAWHKVGAGAWEVVAEASDETYTKGYVGFGARGNIGKLDTIEAGESVSHAHTLTASNGSAPAVRHEAITRLLEATQPQSPLANRALTRGAFTATQAQVASVRKEVGRHLSATQAQVATRSTTLAKVLRVAQAQVATRSTALARAFSISQGSSPTLARALTHALAATQPSAASKQAAVARTLALGATQVATRLVGVARSLGAAQPSSAAVARSASHSFAATQTQAATRGATVARTLSTSQGQVSTRQTAISRLLAATQAAVAAKAVALARTLRVGQGQAATQEGSTGSGVHDHPHTLEAAQGASAALQRALARRLTAAQGQGASLGRAASRTLAISGGATAQVGRALTRALSTSSTAAASLQRTQVAPHLSAMASSSASLRRVVMVGLATTTGSAASLEFAATQVPLPPPVNMSSSVSVDGAASSVGQDRLTSSVEAR